MWFFFFSFPSPFLFLPRSFYGDHSTNLQLLKNLSLFSVKYWFQQRVIFGFEGRGPQQPGSTGFVIRSAETNAVDCGGRASSIPGPVPVPRCGGSRAPLLPHTPCTLLPAFACTTLRPPLGMPFAYPSGRPPPCSPRRRLRTPCALPGSLQPPHPSSAQRAAALTAAATRGEPCSSRRSAAAQRPPPQPAPLPARGYRPGPGHAAAHWG